MASPDKPASSASPFCLSCGSALDEYGFCSHCEAFGDEPDDLRDRLDGL